MAELNIYNADKKVVGSVALPKAFDGKVRKGLLYQVATAQLTNRRQGNAKVKTRHEVAGSTRKIVSQKGTGGARHGDIKAPIFVGGGRAFGPKPRDYEVRLPQKIRNQALVDALMDRREEGRLWVLDGLKFDKPETKKAAKILKAFEFSGVLAGAKASILFVVNAQESALEKSVRNMERVSSCRVEAVSVTEVLKHNHVVASKEAFESLMNRVARIA